MSALDYVISKATEELKERIAKLEQEKEEEYSRGVTAGKLEALKYTPQEREAYGKHVAQYEQYSELKQQLAEARKERDRLQDSLTPICQDITTARERIAELERNSETWTHVLEMVRSNGFDSVGAVLVSVDKLRERIAELEAALLLDKPWPLRDIVSTLCDAASILLFDKGYDGHGHEQLSHALSCGQDWMSRNYYNTALAASSEGK